MDGQHITFYQQDLYSEYASLSVTWGNFEVYAPQGQCIAMIG